MTLTDEQRAAIASWIEAGANLSEIQKRLKEELGISLTYFETRLLADDLKLQIKEVERPADPAPVLDASAAPESAPGKVTVTIDQLTRPGAMVSGRVVFSDGEKGEWFLDQTGRLGLNPDLPGYKPAQADIAAFQSELEKAARAQGL